MQTTANYGLKKPEGNDTVDIDVINGNMDSIDGELKKLSGAMGDDPDFKTTLSSAISAKTNQVDFNNHVNALTAHGIGDRTQLKTAAKDTIVNALNELKTAIPSVPVQSVNGKTGSVSLGASDITVSDSSNHFLSNPKSVENVLAELFTSGTNGKNDIYNAISAKGTTPESKKFSDLVSAIGNISTGRKYAHVTLTSSSSKKAFNGSTTSAYYVTIPKNSMNFTPAVFHILPTNKRHWPTIVDPNGLYYGNFDSQMSCIMSFNYTWYYDSNCYDDNNYYFPVQCYTESECPNTAYDAYMYE